MKILLSAILILAFVFSNQAQAPRVGEANKIKVKWYKDGWIVDGGIGMRTFGRRSENIDRIPGFSAHGGLGYKFDDIWGVRGRMDYFNHILRPGFQEGDQSMAHTIGLSLLGTADLIPWITGRKGTTWHLISYLGGGLSTSWNKDYQNYIREAGIQDPGDIFIDGHDDMGHFMVGITPQYHLSSRFALTADISTMLLIVQDRTFDYGEVLNRGKMGAIMNFSFGFIWYPHF